ncbi:LOB domain-containing protein 38-like [Chenopodium quinoa]|uniref:LOB domain-containing protein n=1 Tax=Chenopodium quinoa TaxID=63459 RepID=A0A803KY78_CHEQI|nr:LOB domain-containing protein 38-like [Chenopodium quinoa]
MSCNGCRVLRKGCSESCILRPCLQWIDTPESQGHATVFVAKFFGRAGLMSFISNVPDSQRPALFQSLLYEACGRTVNPVSGAVGLLWTGNWHVCQAAVETVLRGGTLRPISEFLVGAPPSPVPTIVDADDNSEVVCPSNSNTNTWRKQIGGLNMMHQDVNNNIKKSRSSPPPPRFTNSKRRKEEDDYHVKHLDLSLTPPTFLHAPPQQRPGTPSLNSEESATTVSFESDNYYQPKLLNLFVG